MAVDIIAPIVPGIDTNQHTMNSNADLKEAPEALGFFALPREVRDMIYLLLVHPPKQVGREEDDEDEYQNNAILSANRPIRELAFVSPRFKREFAESGPRGLTVMLIVKENARFFDARRLLHDFLPSPTSMIVEQFQ